MRGNKTEKEALIGILDQHLPDSLQSTYEKEHANPRQNVRLFVTEPEKAEPDNDQEEDCLSDDSEERPPISKLNLVLATLTRQSHSHFREQHGKTESATPRTKG